jgi:hypothetical protein
MGHPAGLKSSVMALVEAEPVPPRADRRWAALGLAALAALAMVALLVVWGGPAHAAGRPAAAGAWVVAGMLVVAAAATWCVLPARRAMLGRPRGRLLAVVLGVPLFLGLWLLLWHTRYVDPFERVGLSCLALTLATAPWPFAVLVYLGRRFEPRHPAWMGAALGSAAGAWAALMVELWCPLADPGHVALGHVLPLVLLTLAAAGLGGRLFSLPRFKLRRP